MVNNPSIHLGKIMAESGGGSGGGGGYAQIGSSIAGIFSGGGNSSAQYGNAKLHDLEDQQADIWNDYQGQKQFGLAHSPEGDIGTDSQPTSIPPVQSIAQKAGEWAKNFGKQYGGQMLAQMSNKLMNHQVDKMLAPSAGDMRTSARRRGENDALYDKTRFPQATQWDILGKGGASGQGGASSSATAAEGQRKAASISAQPNLIKANLEWQRQPEITSELQKRGQLHLAGAKKASAEVPHTQAKTVNQEMVNRWQNDLSRAQTALTQRNTDKSSAQAANTRQDTKNKIQTLLTEIQKTGIAKHDKSIKKALANVATWLAVGKVAAPIGGALGALSWALSSFKKRGAGKVTEIISENTGQIFKRRRGK